MLIKASHSIPPSLALPPSHPTASHLPSRHHAASNLGGCQHMACLFWSLREWLSNLLKMQIRSGHHHPLQPSQDFLWPQTEVLTQLPPACSHRTPPNPASGQPLLLFASFQAFHFSLSLNTPSSF